jgi:hypothetical protein
MSSDEDRILDRLAYIAGETKRFDAEPRWVRITSRQSERWSLVVGLRVAGALIGASVRIVTPVDAWEEDVYGHIEVRLSSFSYAFRVDALEWRPLRPHDNPAGAPFPHGGQRLFDRHHPFDLNRPLGLRVFRQGCTGIAVPLPATIGSFTDYADMCSNVWKCPDMMGLTPPEWSRPML